MPDIKWLLASDIHFPAHDPRALNIWLDVLDYFKPDAVDLLGDIDNADSTSKWMEGTSGEGFSKNSPDIAMTRAFLADVSQRTKRSVDLHFHDGNHGWTRHEKWLDKNQPNTLADGVYSPDSIYEYSQHGWNWHRYDEPPVQRFGGIYAHHGVSISKNSGESVRNDVQSFGVSLIRGHSHRLGDYRVNFPLPGRELRGWEIGHLCNPNAPEMSYDRAPNWQQGFAIGLVSGDNVHIQLIEIINHEAWVLGKKFTG